MTTTSPMRDRVRAISAALRAAAASVELLFVTNLRDGELVDIGPDGVVNAGQYYSRREADEIIRRFQDLGVTVRPFFSESEFLNALTTGLGPTTRSRVVFTTAEGGTGVGRRALIPAACSLAGLPCLNSGPHASSIARHKFHANAVLRRVGVRTPETWMYQSGGWMGALAPQRGTRVILKPMFESIVHRRR